MGNCQRIVRNGFSLVEVMVALGVLGVGSMAMMSMISGVATSQKNLEDRSNMNQFSNDMQALLSDGSSCISALGGGSQSFNIAASKTAQGADLEFRLNGETIGKNTTIKSYRIVSDRIFATEGTLAGVDSTGRNVYAAHLSGLFKPVNSTAKSSGLTDYAARSMGLIFLTLDSSSRIVACTKKSPLDQALANDFCLEFGGTYDSSTRKCNLVDFKDAKTVVQICESMGLPYDSIANKCDLSSIRSTASTSGPGSSTPAVPTPPPMVPTGPTSAGSDACAALGGSYNSTTGKCSLDILMAQFCQSAGGTYNASTKVCTQAASSSSSSGSTNLPAGYGGIGKNCSNGKEHGEIWLISNKNDDGGFQMGKCSNGVVTTLINYKD